MFACRDVLKGAAAAPLAGGLPLAANSPSARYDEADAKLAWEHTLKFFGAHP